MRVDIEVRHSGHSGWTYYATLETEAEAMQWLVRLKETRPGKIIDARIRK